LIVSNRGQPRTSYGAHTGIMTKARREKDHT
jgi:hypothetical protein